MANSGAQSLRTTGASARDDGRTPAQWYCLLAGAALLLAGITGFIADATFDTGSEIDGGSLLGFEVNGWHNLVHLASGAVLLAASAKRKTAKTVAIAFGAVYGLVALIGLIDGKDIFGLIPVNPADNVLHIALSLLGIVAGLVSDADDRTGRDRVDTADRDRITRDVDPLSGRDREPSSTSPTTTRRS
jgi:Domain of unknown function (DUF4383)